LQEVAQQEADIDLSAGCLLPRALKRRRTGWPMGMGMGIILLDWTTGSTIPGPGMYEL
jgi:hypothetical protein